MSKPIKNETDWYGGTKAYYFAGLVMLLPNYLVLTYVLQKLPDNLRFVGGATIFFASSYGLSLLIMHWVRKQPVGSKWRVFFE